MKRLWIDARESRPSLAALTVPVGAQDYRARVQGIVVGREPGRDAGRHGHAAQRRAPGWSRRT